MERKKMTKVLIGESLKELMRDHPFEKITIKMITDEAGVIRPTFYNYFCDKYEVVEWIFNESIIDKVRSMFDQKMYTEGLKLLFVCMKNDCAFYKKAFEITGQKFSVPAFYLRSQCSLHRESIHKPFADTGDGCGFLFYFTGQPASAVDPEQQPAIFCREYGRCLRLSCQSQNTGFYSSNRKTCRKLNVSDRFSF